MKYNHVFKTEKNNNNWTIHIESIPYINIVKWFSIFAIIFYGGGLIGGFKLVFGELNFMEKSNRRIFLLLFLAWYIPIFVIKIVKPFLKQYTKVIWLSNENLWTINDKNTKLNNLIWENTEDMHGNDIWEIWLCSQENPKEKALIYQSPTREKAQELFKEWSGNDAPEDTFI